MPNTFKYNIQPRTLKNKTVYDVFFYVDTLDGRKQKRLCGFTTKKLARQAYEKFMETYIAAPKEFDNKHVVLYEEAFKSYLGAIRLNIRESTMYDIIHIFQLHIDKDFIGKDIANIKKQDINLWLEHLWTKTHNGKPYSQKTLMRIFAFFSSFYKWCVSHYGITNAMTDIKPPKRRDNKEPRKIWTHLRKIMTDLYHNASRAAEQYGTPGNLVAGANIAGFLKVGESMLAYGIV